MGSRMAPKGRWRAWMLARMVSASPSAAREICDAASNRRATEHEIRMRDPFAALDARPGPDVYEKFANRC